MDDVLVNGRVTTIESSPTGVLVNGTFRVTFRGAFVPGNDPESDWDELEVSTLDGGGAADDAEVDTGAVDTFIGCEL